MSFDCPVSQLYSEQLPLHRNSMLGSEFTLNTLIRAPHTNIEMEQINFVLRNALHTFWCSMISNLSANELESLRNGFCSSWEVVSQKSCWLREKCNTGVKQTWWGSYTRVTHFSGDIHTVTYLSKNMEFAGFTLSGLQRLSARVFLILVGEACYYVEVIGIKWFKLVK